MAIEWEVRPMTVPGSVREWMTVAHDPEGFWCMHWRRIRYADENASVLVWRRGPYETAAVAQSEGSRMAHLEGVNFYMPEIRRKQPEPIRPADAAARFAKATMDAWLALPSPRARKLAFIAFLSRAAEAANEMIEYEPEEREE